MDAIQQAGSSDLELVSSQDVVRGAAQGEANARAYGTVGANIRASKP